MSFYFLYNVVSENHSVQNSPWGGGEGGLLPAQGLIGNRSTAYANFSNIFFQSIRNNPFDKNIEESG